MAGKETAFHPGRFPDITGVILAGGLSTRMGEDKALLQVDGTPIIQRICDVMLPHFPQLLLSTNTPDRYEFLSLISVRDVVDGAGPLAGIHAALKAAETDRICVMSCDAAGITHEIVVRLCEQAMGSQAVLLGDGAQLYPLMAVYRRSLLPMIEERLHTGFRSLHGLLAAVPHQVLRPQWLRKNEMDRIFSNINTPDDYRQFERTTDQD